MEKQLNVIEAEIEDALKAQIKQGVQTIQYQIETLMTTNGQTPFVTLFMCLSEAKTDADRKDLAMMIEELLKQRIQGIMRNAGTNLQTDVKLAFSRGQEWEGGDKKERNPLYLHCTEFVEKKYSFAWLSVMSNLQSCKTVKRQ